VFFGIYCLPCQPLVALPAGSIAFTPSSVVSYRCHKNVIKTKAEKLKLKDIGVPKSSHDFGKEMHR